jgi:hypothetical protein
MAEDSSAQTWSINKDDYVLNEVIGEYVARLASVLTS